MSWLCAILVHRWSRWKLRTASYSGGVTVQVLTRACGRCGDEQTKPRSMVSL